VFAALTSQFAYVVIGRTMPKKSAMGGFDA
jgi:hypothetical protein